MNNTKKETLMKIIRNIRWAVIIILAVGYAIGTATAETDKNSRDHSTGVHDARTTLSARWKKAETGNSLPTSFRDKQPNTINRADALYRAFDILCLSGRPLRILQLGDSHVAAGSYPAAVRKTLEEAWGKAENDTTGQGVVYSFMARNGATASQFANRERMEKIAAARPDLIILSFGTNECHGMGYREELHRTQLEDFYDMLSETCPNAVIMMTTPPGDYLTTRSTRFVRNRKGRKSRKVVHSSSRVNPMSARCAGELESFGEEHGLAVWNLNGIAGGPVAVRNWTAAKMMRPDRIHFTPEGYQLHGRLLGEAILGAYNDYLEN